MSDVWPLVVVVVQPALMGCNVRGGTVTVQQLQCSSVCEAAVWVEAVCHGVQLGQQGLGINKMGLNMKLDSVRLSPCESNSAFNV